LLEKNANSSVRIRGSDAFSVVIGCMTKFPMLALATFMLFYLSPAASAGVPLGSPSVSLAGSGCE